MADAMSLSSAWMSSSAHVLHMLRLEMSSALSFAMVIQARMTEGGLNPGGLGGTGGGVLVTTTWCVSPVTGLTITMPPRPSG